MTTELKKAISDGDKNKYNEDVIKDNEKKLREKENLVKTVVSKYKEVLSSKNPEEDQFICSNKVGYESIIMGSGLIGNYYNHNFFKGDPIKRLDPFIDFVWVNESSIKGLSYINFSITWEGGIIAPMTKSYKFRSTTDDGSLVLLSGKPIIQDKISWDEELEQPSPITD